MSSVALVWDETLARYDFGASHPLNQRRLHLTLGLLDAAGLLARDTVLCAPPRAATLAELHTVHAPEFVAAVQQASTGEAPATALRRFGLGTEDVPIVTGMHDAAALVAGATLTAAQLVIDGHATRAFSIAGGLHHARRAEASGFCVYNDLAVAIRWLRATHGARVLYIDIDAHHGDGVQWLFYDDPDVLTVSLHESGAYIYPGTGFIDELGSGDGYGTSVNVPLEMHTGDASWRDCFTAIVPPLADAFAPDVIVLQAGCDTHALDPLTHLRCTTGLVEWAVQQTVALADAHCAGRVVMTGGGGYAIETVVPRAWTLAFAALLGVHVADAVPDDWIAAVGNTAVPRTLRDAPDALPALPAADAAARTNTRTIGALRQRVLPLLTGWGMAF